MKLRHVLLLTSVLGATGALLLALDLYRRLQEAQAQVDLNNLPQRPDSVLTFGAPHALGLVSLTFLFLATMLLLIAALRDRNFSDAVDRTPPAATPPAPPSVPPAKPEISDARSYSLNELAAAAPESWGAGVAPVNAEPPGTPAVLNPGTVCGNKDLSA